MYTHTHVNRRQPAHIDLSRSKKRKGGKPDISFFLKDSLGPRGGDGSPRALSPGRDSPLLNRQQRMLIFWDVPKSVSSTLVQHLPSSLRGALLSWGKAACLAWQV